MTVAATVTVAARSHMGGARNGTAIVADPSVPEELHLETLGGYVVVTLLCAAVAHCMRRAFERGSLHRSRARKEAWVGDAIDAMRVVSLVFTWYGLSVSFTLFNKWLLRLWRGGTQCQREPLRGRT